MPQFTPEFFDGPAKVSGSFCRYRGNPEEGARTKSWTESVRLGVRECQATRTSRRAWPSTWSTSAAGGDARDAQAGVSDAPDAVLLPEPRDASHEGKAGRPWSHCDPALKAQVVALVRSGMVGKDVAEMLGVSSVAVVYNWARAAESPSPAAADRSP